MTYAKQFLIAAALALTACDETSRPVAPTDEPEPPIVAQADQGISQLARAAAAALGAPAVRHSILAAMRASRRSSTACCWPTTCGARKAPGC